MIKPYIASWQRIWFSGFITACMLAFGLYTAHREFIMHIQVVHYEDAYLEIYPCVFKGIGGVEVKTQCAKRFYVEQK